MQVLRHTQDALSLRLDPPGMLRSVTAAALFFAVPALVFGVVLRDWRAIGFAVAIVPILGTCWGVAYLFLWPHYRYDLDRTLGQLRVLPQRLLQRGEPIRTYAFADVQEVTIHTVVWPRRQLLGQVWVVLRDGKGRVEVPDVLHAQSRWQDDAALIAGFIGAPLRLPEPTA
jgi:hypothetical protein